MDYISIFAASSYVDPVGLCCVEKKKIPAKKAPVVCWEVVIWPDCNMKNCKPMGDYQNLVKI
jgi:hypothetical protein